MYLVVSASPNKDGLTAACAAMALAGFQDAGVQARHLDLCGMSIERCRQCENGWGDCWREHVCVINDDLRTLQQALADADGVVIISPVYFGEMSESAKSALDRIRRCEATRGEDSALAGTPIIAVAAAGGSGGGVTTCLLSMERFIQHVRGQVVDLIGITQRDRAYTLEAIRAAAAGIAASSS